MGKKSLVFICVSFTINKAEHLLRYFLAICISSSVSFLFVFFFQFPVEMSFPY